MKKNKKLLLNTLLPIITPIPALVGSFYLISGNFNFLFFFIIYTLKIYYLILPIYFLIII